MAFADPVVPSLSVQIDEQVERVLGFPYALKPIGTDRGWPSNGLPGKVDMPMEIGLELGWWSKDLAFEYTLEDHVVVHSEKQ